MRTCLRVMGSLLLGWALSTVGVSAQDTRGTISGTVTDPQGGVLPGVAVTVTNAGTGTTTRLTTNSSGYYEAALLLPGEYSVTAKLHSDVEFPITIDVVKA